MEKKNPRKKHHYRRKKYGSKFIIAVAVLLVALCCAASALLVSAFGIHFREGMLTQDQIDQAINLAEEDPELLGESSAPLSGEVSGDLVKKKGAYTFIVGGSSNGFINTDTLMLVYFEPAAGKLNILQIPRDTYVVNTGGSSRKINAAYAYQRGDGLKKTIADTFGIAVDNYVVIGTQTFREVVDKIGGVTVTVPMDMDYEDPAQDLYIHLKAGTQTLDGDKAEQFVRFRKGYVNQDLGRMNAQKVFLSAMADKLFSIDGVTKMPGIISTVFQNLRTDMSVADMIGYATKCFDLDTSAMQFFSLPGESYKNGTYVSIYKDETIALLNAYFNPYTRDLTEDDVNIRELSRTYADQYVQQGSTVDDVNGMSGSASGAQSAAGSGASAVSGQSAAAQTAVAAGGTSGSSGTPQKADQGVAYVRYCVPYETVAPLCTALADLGFEVRTSALAIRFAKSELYCADDAPLRDEVTALLPGIQASSGADSCMYEFYIGTDYKG